MTVPAATVAHHGRTRIRRLLASSSGQGLIELIITLTVLALVFGGLFSVLDASQLSLERSDQYGTALTLAEKQIEVYRTLAYANIRLDQTAINTIPGTDPYMTAHSSDSTIPSGAAGSQVVGGTNGENACPYPDPVECTPIQNNVVGPDHNTYRIDTYITYVTPTGGRQEKQVFVVVRDASDSSLPIVARLASTFDSSDIATG